MGVRPEAFFENPIDAREAQAVVEGEQQEGNGKISGYETHAHLQVGHLRGADPSGHADEGNAAHAGTHHAERYHRPRRTAPGTKEGVIVCRSPGTKGNDAKQGEVDHNGGQEYGCHIAMAAALPTGT